MNKKKILLVCLIGVFFLSLSISCVNAAETVGADKLQKGDTFNYSEYNTMSGLSKNFSTGIESEGEISGRSGKILNISRVDSVNNEVDVKIISYSGIEETYTYTSGDYIENSTTSDGTEIITWTDADEDGLVESHISIDVDVELIPPQSDAEFAWVIAGSWENFTDPINPELKQDLEWAKGNLTDFDYSLTLKDREFKVSIDYKRERYDWESGGLMNGSVIYDYHEEYIVTYDDNLALTKCKELVRYKINSIENDTYLEENELKINLNSVSETLIVRGTISEEAIPGFGLITLLGITTLAILGAIYMFKHKKH